MPAALQPSRVAQLSSFRPETPFCCCLHLVAPAGQGFSGAVFLGRPLCPAGGGVTAVLALCVVLRPDDEGARRHVGNPFACGRRRSCPDSSSSGGGGSPAAHLLRNLAATTALRRRRARGGLEPHGRRAGPAAVRLLARGGPGCGGSTRRAHAGASAPRRASGRQLHRGVVVSPRLWSLPPHSSSCCSWWLAFSLKKCYAFLPACPLNAC